MIENNLTDDEVEVLKGLTDRGFAVIVFTPDELKEASPKRVEEALISEAWDVIELLQGI